jgi:tetratricopeptide (TPR) repeat protein
VQFENALAIEESVLGKDPPNTATAYYNIGSVLHAKGGYDGALSQYETVLGKGHIGSVLRAKSDYDGALVQHGMALAVRETVSGQDHPSTANLYNNIGYVLKKGDYDGALEQYEKALTIFESVHGTD